MRKNTWLLTSVLILTFLGSSVNCSSDLGKAHMESAVNMMKMLPSDASGLDSTDLRMIRSDADLANMWSYLQSEASYVENVDIMATVSKPRLSLRRGSQVAEYITELNRTCNETYEYKGIKIWKDKYYYVTFINSIGISGSEETVRRCIDVVKGDEASLYDKVEDIVDLMPNGYMLAVVNWDATHGNDSESYLYEGMLTMGYSVANEGDNDRETTILKFRGFDAAQQYTEKMKERGLPSIITQDGVFVTEVVIKPNIWSE